MNPGDIVLQLRSVQMAVQTALDHALRDVGITAAQLSLLDALMRLPGASSAELARECGVTAQSMHGVLLNLEAAGLLVREPHRVHKRVLRTYLSNAGEVRLAAGRVAIAGVEERMLASLSAEEIDAFRRALAVSSGALTRG